MDDDPSRGRRRPARSECSGACGYTPPIRHVAATIAESSRRRPSSGGHLDSASRQQDRGGRRERAREGDAATQPCWPVDGRATTHHRQKQRRGGEQAEAHIPPGPATAPRQPRACRRRRRASRGRGMANPAAESGAGARQPRQGRRAEAPRAPATRRRPTARPAREPSSSEPLAAANPSMPSARPARTRHLEPRCPAIPKPGELDDRLACTSLGLHGGDPGVDLLAQLGEQVLELLI